ncbi:MAG: PspA/IM30 family protein [Oscillospiraceae bacterium]|nr:PspA/IM30 family protein [Oscillospiraceae bacterium]
MGILSRFADIMNANITALLEKAETENADVLLEKYLRDAKQDLAELKTETAAIIAEEMAAGRKVNALEKEIETLTKYAEQAVLAGNDGDALKFLEGKAAAVKEKAIAEELYAGAKANSDRMRELTKKLMADINTAATKLAELKGKLAVAEQAEKMEERNDRLSASLGSGMARFDSLVDAVERRIDEIDAKKGLNKELSDEFSMDSLKEKYSTAEAAATAAEGLSAELAALKAKLGK